MLLKLASVVPIAKFSLMLFALNAIAVGSSFTLLIVIAKLLSKLSPPASVVRSRIE